MKIERSWNGAKRPGEEKTPREAWKEITKDRAARELANKHGDDALKKLANTKGGLETRFAQYRIAD